MRRFFHKLFYPHETAGPPSPAVTTPTPSSSASTNPATSKPFTPLPSVHSTPAASLRQSHPTPPVDHKDSPKPEVQAAKDPHAFRCNFNEKYTLGKTLGTGSFATVRECTRISDGTKFAVKIIDKGPLKGKIDVLVNEIRLLKRIQHSNIIRLFDLDETRTHLYLVTELATGGELFDRILAQGSYTEMDASVLVKQLLDAVHYLHNEGIVHRDLKPENLLFRNPDEDADLMLTDFGLSKMVKEDEFLKTTCGTPHYVAPEILRQKGYGKPVDMWAIGVITYVLLCGYTPFWAGKDNSNAVLFKAILDCDYQFDEEYWSEISETAKDFIRKLLIVDPTHRMTAAQALEHPWLKTRRSVNLRPSVYKGFNARKKFRGAVFAVSGANRVARASSMSSGRLKQAMNQIAAVEHQPAIPESPSVPVSGSGPADAVSEHEERLGTTETVPDSHTPDTGDTADNKMSERGDLPITANRDADRRLPATDNITAGNDLSPKRKDSVGSEHDADIAPRANGDLSLAEDASPLAKT
ncbi:kinase-like domain-containing protein [Gaertneriomyces semiglobifer]|nr:kinase-like domain-containing protein [Gaertneriomyces semiglobifer]